ncbi:MAG: PAS domain S-box protein, partial [Planctomycetaceae bacterium]|nr:PAS domain S-box protein [Planctomycetaceae bacterium]
MIDFAKSRLQTAARLIGTLVELQQLEKKSEALHRGVLSSMVDPMISINSRGIIHSVSDSVEKVFGWTLDEMIGQNISMLLPEPHRSLHDSYLVNYMKTGETNILGQTREFEVVRKDDSIFPCELTVSRTDLFADGDPLFTGIVRDISERKQQEETQRKLETKLQQAQKLESLGVLAGGIAHDFNNLLMGVLGNARIVLEDMSPASPVRDSIQQIETAAMRAAELTRQMLAYSGRGKFVIQRIDISELVEEIGHLLEVSIGKNVVIKYNLASKLPAIEVDVTQVRQVVMNLITNASDAIGDKSGVVTITTGAMDADGGYLSETYLDDDLTEGTYVFLEVSDTGCGMDDVTKIKLFDPFFTTKAAGRGLGLAATLGIMRGHRGAIKVYSELGQGTTFKAMFRASDAPPGNFPKESFLPTQRLAA